MNWQLLLVVLLVAGAGLYLVRQTVRTWTGGKAGCGGGCGCAKSPAPTADGTTFIPVDQITLRRRERESTSSGSHRAGPKVS